MNVHIHFSKNPDSASENFSRTVVQPSSDKLSDRYAMNKSRFIRSKTESEVLFLEQQFMQDPSWSRKTVQFCKDYLNLGTTQIYKWGFDKKKLFKKYSRIIVKLSNNAKPGSEEYFGAFFSYLRMLNQKKSRKFRKGKNKIKVAEEKEIQPLLCADQKEELGLLNLDKPIDYEHEVDEVLKLVDDQANNCNKRRSDRTHNCSRSNDQMSVVKGIPSESNNHWLDELWREEFNASSYVSSSSDYITPESLFEKDEGNQYFCLTFGSDEELNNTSNAGFKEPLFCDSLGSSSL
ncbi:unnamed protein product [Moneuplotes crassus]|uniref:Uncharacterized protein n=1 Tax=Euplotes crassus TaxID=5936 RepID=A0AAD2D0C7_EUPCR|nr:unnamed protein product [Moneuplotes crassus]